VSQGSLVLTLEPAEQAPEPAAEARVSAEAEKAAAPQPAASAAPAAKPEAPREAPAAERAPEAEPREAPPAPPSTQPPAATLPEVDEAAFALAHASPAVRRMARELGVDLGQVRGTGRKGRILREDVQNHVKETLSRVQAGGGLGLDLPAWPEVDFERFGAVETVALSRIQKISGPYLARNWVMIPHVTQHDEADITELEAFRKSQADAA